MQKQRNIADQLHIDLRDLGDDPIRRQASDADDEAEDGREHDADARDQKRVQEADEEGAAIGRALLGGEGDQMLVDVEAAGRAQEIETENLALRREIRAGVLDRRIEQESDD